MSYFRTMNHSPENLLSINGEALLYKDFLPMEEADHFFSTLKNEIAWKQEAIRIFGKEVMQPRLTSWYGDPGASYTYSGITMEPLPWTDSLLLLKQKAEYTAQTAFNSVLLNFYRSNEDSMGWHRDNEKTLGAEPVIASISLGMPRIFQFRKYKEKERPLSFLLSHGSLLVMKKSTQTYWEHRVPKSAKPMRERINLTFRKIK